MEQFDVEKYYRDQDRYRTILHIMPTSGQQWKDNQTVAAIYKNWSKLFRELSTEDVLCRRKHKQTERFQRLLKEFRETQEELEQAVMMYSLIYA